MNDRKIAFGIVLTSILVILFICNLSLKSEEIIDYSVFLNEIRNDRVSEVVIASFIIQGERNDGTKFRSVRPNIQDPQLMDDLVNYNVNVVHKEREQASMFSQLLVAAIPIMLYLMCMIGGSYYLARRKTNHPIFAAIIGGGFALIPPLGLIYLAFLVFKKDVA
ncbi:ATP-dependent metallopeptidase FtsH/Yme1/Tma family protein [Gammaproteobacteria bacterium]|nr:ATP-dependent metallopeptidase FtsH/Yme1/Tma family protein [Gammaproteobacteria bacterium]|tara:strand:- start:205 stop:696 length:492 start_codon:yes stop_codon:yes gene_type:complete